MSKINLNSLKTLLTRDEMRVISGGSGGWACGCWSGVNITNAPGCSSSICNWACQNQGGWTGGCVCTGSGC